MKTRKRRLEEAIELLNTEDQILRLFTKPPATWQHLAQKYPNLFTAFGGDLEFYWRVAKEYGEAAEFVETLDKACKEYSVEWPA